MSSVLARLKRAQNLFVRLVLQKFLVPVLLTLIYVAVLGPMSLVFRGFGRSPRRRRRLGQESYWVKATGYDPDPQRSLQQS